MHRVVIAIAALLGLAGGFVAAFLIGFEETVAPECDGPCFDRLDEVFWRAVAAGLGGALLLGLIAWFLLRRRPLD